MQQQDTPKAKQPLDTNDLICICGHLRTKHYIILGLHLGGCYEGLTCNCSRFRKGDTQESEAA